MGGRKGSSGGPEVKWQKGWVVMQGYGVCWVWRRGLFVQGVDREWEVS